MAIGKSGQTRDVSRYASCTDDLNGALTRSDSSRKMTPMAWHTFGRQLRRRRLRRPGQDSVAGAMESRATAGRRRKDSSSDRSADGSRDAPPADTWVEPKPGTQIHGSGPRVQTERSRSPESGTGVHSSESCTRRRRLCGRVTSRPARRVRRVPELRTAVGREGRRS